MKWLCAPLLATVAAGQQIDLGILDKLASRAKSSVNVTLDADKLKFASMFLSNEDPKQVGAKDVVSKLKALNVRVFEFDRPGSFTSSDLDVIRAQVKGPGWTKVVEARERDESAEVYMFNIGKELGGLMIIAAERQELVVVNIVGPVDMKMLGELGGNFGIPRDVLGGAPLAPPPPPRPSREKGKK
jgi:hypothetical protein